MDKRVYVMNFSGFMPSDLPRPDTNDILTRTLRPEFVRDYPDGSVSAEAVRADVESRSESDGVGDGVGDGNSSSGSYTRMNGNRDTDGDRDADMNGQGGAGSGSGGGDSPVVTWIRAATYQQVKLIPDVVAKLDAMTTVPIDSYGLTEFLHSHGVNMRYLGEIYTHVLHI
jgi:hypothetical protein